VINLVGSTEKATAMRANHAPPLITIKHIKTAFAVISAVPSLR
jgi:hypothetical protein